MKRWSAAWLVGFVLVASSAGTQPNPEVADTADDGGGEARPASGEPAQAKPDEAPSARPAQPPEPNRPWAAGVSADQQHRALELFARANGRFAESDYVGALPLYRQALASWDHPAVQGTSP